MKLLLSGVISLLWVQLSWAQVTFNPQIGTNVSTLTAGPKGETTSSRMSYQFGANLRIGGKLYVSPGVYWLQLSTELEAQKLSGDIKDNTNLNTIHLPVVVGYKVIDHPDWKLRVFAGPAVSFITRVNSNRFNLSQYDFKNPITTGKFGVGADWKRFTLDLTYDLGINNVFNNEANARYNLVGLSIGYKFGGMMDIL